MSEGYRYLFLHSLAVFMKRSEWIFLVNSNEICPIITRRMMAFHQFIIKHPVLLLLLLPLPASKHDELLLKCKMSRDSSGFPLGLSVFCQGFDNFGIQGLWPRSVIEKIGCNCQKVGQFEKRACTVIEFESVNFSPLFHVAKCIFHPQCFCKYCWRGQAAPGSDVVRVTVTLMAST